MMKNKLRDVAASVIFCCVFMFCLMKCMELLENKTAKQQYEAFYESETNFDVIFLGTSHMYNTIFPQELWKEYGISSYNWGYMNCTVAESYYILQDVQKYTNPKLIVLDMYGLLSYENWGNGKYRTDRIEQQHVQFDSIPLSMNKIKASQDIFDDYSGNLDFLFNFIMYHNRWTELAKQDFEITLSTEKGASFLDGLKKDIEYECVDADEKIEIDTVCYKYLLKLLEYCEENEIQLLCIYSPYPAPTKEQRVANTLEDVISQYEYCDYVNLLNEDLLNFKTDIHADGGHVNYMGGCKVTSWLGEYILEHYDIPSHTDDDIYAESWNRDYEKYVQFRAKKITSVKELYEHLLLAYGGEFTVELQIADGCNAIDEDEILRELIAGLGDWVSVEGIEQPKLEDKKYDIVITIKRGEKVIQTNGYQYENKQTTNYVY